MHSQAGSVQTGRISHNMGINAHYSQPMAMANRLKAEY